MWLNPPQALQIIGGVSSKPETVSSSSDKSSSVSIEFKQLPNCVMPKTDQAELLAELDDKINKLEEPVRETITPTPPSTPKPQKQVIFSHGRKVSKFEKVLNFN